MYLKRKIPNIENMLENDLFTPQDIQRVNNKRLVFELKLVRVMTLYYSLLVLGTWDVLLVNVEKLLESAAAKTKDIPEEEEVAEEAVQDANAEEEQEFFSSQEEGSNE